MVDVMLSGASYGAPMAKLHLASPPPRQHMSVNSLGNPYHLPQGVSDGPHFWESLLLISWMVTVSCVGSGAATQNAGILIDPSLHVCQIGFG